MNDAKRRQTLGEVVGGYFATARVATGVRQDDVASAAKQAGLQWGRSTIANLEAGRRKLSAEELILLPLAAALAFPDYKISLHDWLRQSAESPTIELTPDARISGLGITRFMAGEVGDFGISEVHVPYLSETRTVLREAFDAVRGLRDDYWGSGSLSSVARAVQATDDTDRKAAAALQVDPAVVAVVSRRLWGRSLAAERDGRASDQERDGRSLAAIRGHVTRSLTSEIRSHLEQHEGDVDGEHH